MTKEIRPLQRYNANTEQTEIFYPATTTDAIAHPTKRKSLTNVISDIETHNGAYDISAANSGTTYADLAAALDSNNGGGVPQSLQKGGMSVKFVQSSDNKYVEYFLTKNTWSASEANWEKINLEEEVSQLDQKARVSYVGGRLYTQVNDFELGNINTSGVPRDDTARARSINFIEIPQIDGTPLNIRVRNSGNYYINFYFYDESFGFISSTPTLNTDRIVEVPTSARFVKMRWIINGSSPSGPMSSDEFNNFYADCYFNGCDNMELLTELKYIAGRQVPGLDLIKFAGYTIVPGFSLSSMNTTTGDLVVKRDTGWGILSPIDISDLADNTTLEVYLGNEQTSGILRYTCVSLAKRFNNGGVWQTHKGQRDMSLGNMGTGADRKTYLIASVHLSELEKCYIKVKNTDTYLFKYSPWQGIAFPSLSKLVIGEWNVGHWSYGLTPSGAPDADADRLMGETKAVLSRLNCDVLFVCEWQTLFNRSGTINAYLEIFKQFFPYASIGMDNGTGTAIFSKYPLASGYDGITTQGITRKYVKGAINVNGNIILVVCCHANPFSATDRVTELTAIAAECSSSDFAIVCGDINTGNNDESQEDITEELQPFVDAGFVLGNYGYFGVKNTHVNEKAVDNIMCKGMQLCTFDVLDERAASDHFPCVSHISFFNP